MKKLVKLVKLIIIGCVSILLIMENEESSILHCVEEHKIESRIKKSYLVTI